MITKKIFSIGLLAMGISSVAHASLTIQNNTSQDSTAIINHAMCSANSILGASGITKAHSPNTITDMVIWYACYATPTNCVADVYMTNNCNASGAPKIATVVFDTHLGIKSVTMYSNQYMLTSGGFSVQLNDSHPGFTTNNNSMW